MVSTVGKLNHVAMLMFLAATVCVCQVPRVAPWDQVIDQSAIDDLHSVVFVDDSVVVAVGSNGVIRRGVPTKEFSDVSGQYGLPTYRSVATDVGTRLVCAGDSGMIGVSNDAGRSWSMSRQGNLGTVRQVAYDRNGSWLFATERGLFKGNPPSTLSLLLDGDFSGVSVARDGGMLAGFSDGRVVSSGDFGNTWVEDAELTTSWPIVKLVEDDNRVLIVHKRFVTWKTQSGNADTSYIPSENGFNFTDLSVVGATWWATGEEFSYGHAYSLDSGKTWNVSSGSLIRASAAIGTRSGTLVCVGARGAVVYGPQESAVNQAFKFYGFAKASIEVPMSTVKDLHSSDDALFVLRDRPEVSLVRYGILTDTLYSTPTALNLQAHDLWVEQSRITVTIDTTGSFETPSGWVSKIKWRICTKGEGDSAFTVIDAPYWGQPITTSYLDHAGYVYIGCAGMPYVYRYSTRTGVLDSLRQFPLESAYAILGTGDTIIALNQSHLATSSDHGETWEVVDTPLPWTPHNSCIGANSRICVVRLESQGNSALLLTATSDDFGQSWTVRQGPTINGAQQPAMNMSSSTRGCIVLSGLGDMILLSIDNGQSFHEIRTPTPATATLFASTFKGKDTVVIGGSLDVLLQGYMDVITTVAGDSATLPSLQLHSIVESIAEYDYQGRLVCEYVPGYEYRVSEYISRSALSRSGMSLLICRTVEGRVLALKVIW